MLPEEKQVMTPDAFTPVLEMPATVLDDATRLEGEPQLIPIKVPAPEKEIFCTTLLLIFRLDAAPPV